MKAYKKTHLNKLPNIIKLNPLNENSLLIVSLFLLIIVNSILSYYAIEFQQQRRRAFLLETLEDRILQAEIEDDTTIFLQKIWNGINGRIFVSCEKFGCGSHHWDITIILLFGPLLKIFDNPFIVIHSTILLFWISIIIFLIFYFSLDYDKKHKTLISFLASLVYLFNETIIYRVFTIDYSSSSLFPTLFTLSILLFLKKRYKLAGFLMLLSYMINLETIPYLVLLFFGTILILFRKNIPKEEKKAIYGFSLLTIIYIILFHFVLYGYLTYHPGENVFSFYYSTRHQTSIEGNLIITLIMNTLDLFNEKIRYVYKNLLFIPPFSLNPSTLFTVLMSLSANKAFISNYISPDSHYNIPNPVFTLLFLWSFLYYKKPKKTSIYLICIVLLITLLIESSYIDVLYRFCTYKAFSTNNGSIEELNYIIENYIRYNGSITTYPTISILFYKNPLVLFTSNMIFSCNPVKKYCEKDKKPILTTYYLLLKKNDTYVHTNPSKICRKDVLEKNFEELGYEKIYDGKYFILFKIKNESMAYYGTPLLDLAKALRSKEI